MFNIVSKIPLIPILAINTRAFRDRAVWAKVNSFVVLERLQSPAVFESRI